MARWLALCPRPIKGDQCLRPQTRKLPVKKFLHFANISRGSLMRYGLKLTKFDDRQRLSPERTGLLITPAVRARGCSFCVRVVLFWFFNETTARMESGFSMVTNQSDRYVGTYTSSWSLLQLRATDFATIWFNTLFMALHFAIIS